MKGFFRYALCIVVLLASTASVVFAQIKVTGMVQDADGPLIGASVLVQGTTRGTITDIDGQYAIEANMGDVLEFSYMGYSSQTITVNGTVINVTMSEDTEVLSEVVVTAMGIKRERKALGYEVGEVKGEDLTKAKETNVVNSLAGRVSGLVVQGTAGGASGSTRVMLRGTTEMTGNNQPLYVIDGVPMDNTNYGSAGTEGGYDLGDGISAINPDDIESMSVLKGPAAAALYGSRASHGVILITTKKADTGDAKWGVEYNGTYTLESQLSQWDNVQQVYGMGSDGQYNVDAVSNTNKSWGPKADGGLMLRYFDGQEHPFLIIPNNTANFFELGMTATNTAVVSMNTGKTGIRFTYSDLRNKDILPNSNMSRNTLNLRANTSIGPVDLDFTVNYTHEDVKNRPALGDDKSNVGKNLMTLATTYDQAWLKNYQNELGEYQNWNGMDPYNVNPYWDIYKNKNQSYKDLVRMNGKVVYNILPQLKVQATVGAELNRFEFSDFKYPTTPGFESGRLQNSYFNNRMVNAELLGIYHDSWGDFDFTATAGANLFNVNNRTVINTGADMGIREVVAMSSFDEQSVEEATYRKRIVSVFGSVNLGWRHMLYLDATVRGDKSSTLASGKNLYVYPSVSGSWVFSELITSNRKVLPYGKVRLSWAEVGSDTDPYQLGLRYGKSQFGYPGYTIGSVYGNTIPNADLKPTRTRSIETGFETKWCNSRISLDFTFYHQNSRDQIIGMATSPTSGYEYRMINAGQILNQGFEITFGSRLVQTKDFTWDLNINWSKNFNKVLSLTEGTTELELAKATWCNVYVSAREGEEYGSICGPALARNEEGRVIVDGATGLPTFTTENKVLGNAQWDWTGGLLTTLRYKMVTFSALFDVKVGADLFSMSERSSFETGKAKETLTGRAEWYASEEARRAAGVTSGWKATGGYLVDGVIDNGDGTYRENDIYINPEDYWMEVSRKSPELFIYDNSYIKCREMTLGLDFPKSWLDKKGVIKHVGISFVARNPFIVWKNIKDIDPDAQYNTSGLGLEYGSLPSRRSYGLNFNIKF
ncbi:MAG: SusC/RagA family TonB-linked outer membrane protein [Paludibacteraceae bacterium]|nr:SusC/RagA family TonB-linked outer membrane protein [Paludibacteraceae bacterium]MBR4548102.1 SusC/RagA family TonB-linked outer membrane protein [Paludibacteraceae bacterium]